MSVVHEKVIRFSDRLGDWLDTDPTHDWDASGVPLYLCAFGLNDALGTDLGAEHGDEAILRLSDTRTAIDDMDFVVAVRVPGVGDFLKYKRPNGDWQSTGTYSLFRRDVRGFKQDSIIYVGIQREVQR